MVKRILKYFALSLLLIAAAGASAYLYFVNAVSPVSEKPYYHDVTIPQGTGVSGIGKILHEKGVIKSPLAFTLMIKYYGAEGAMKAGDYVISSHFTLEEIVKKIIAGDVNTFQVTVPEGLTAAEVRKRLVSMNVATEKDFDAAAARPDVLKLIPFGLDTVEGVLYPETYRFSKKTPVAEILKAMLKEFRLKYPEPPAESEKRLGIKLCEILTLASIVEKEARRDEDRPKIASVFYNRLKSRMRLESCATVQYALGEGRKARLLKSDLQIDSPYNTYKREGLPPTPICSPSLASIKAALNPEKTPYLFFVARPDGYHTFSKTFEEHTAAIREIRKNQGRTQHGREGEFAED